MAASDVPATPAPTGTAQIRATQAPPAWPRRLPLPRIRSRVAATGIIALAAFIFGTGDGVFAFCQLQGAQGHESRLELNWVTERLSVLQRSATEQNQACLATDISPLQRAVRAATAASLQAERRVLADTPQDPAAADAGERCEADRKATVGR